jgi:hypothetical protein
VRHLDARYELALYQCGPSSTVRRPGSPPGKAAQLTTAATDTCDLRWHVSVSMCREVGHCCADRTSLAGRRSWSARALMSAPLHRGRGRRAQGGTRRFGSTGRLTGDMVAAHMGDLFEQPGQRAAKAPSRCRIPFGPVANTRGGVGTGGGGGARGGRGPPPGGVWPPGGSVGPTGGVAAGVWVSLAVGFACVG